MIIGNDLLAGKFILWAIFFHVPLDKAYKLFFGQVKLESTYKGS
jgi:hypothetical protein